MLAHCKTHWHGGRKCDLLSPPYITVFCACPYCACIILQCSSLHGIVAINMWINYSRLQMLTTQWSSCHHLFIIENIKDKHTSSYKCKKWMKIVWVEVRELRNINIFFFQISSICIRSIYSRKVQSFHFIPIFHMTF